MYAVMHKQETCRVVVHGSRQQSGLWLCVAFDVLELLDCDSEPGHALAPAVPCAAPGSS